jgi:hypothetical protein
MAVEPEPYRTLGLKRGATLGRGSSAGGPIAAGQDQPHPTPQGGAFARFPRDPGRPMSWLAGPGTPGVARRPPAPRPRGTPRRMATAPGVRRSGTERAAGRRPDRSGRFRRTTRQGWRAGHRAGMRGAPGSAEWKAGMVASSGIDRQRKTRGPRAALDGRRTYEPRPDSGTPGCPPLAGSRARPEQGHVRFDLL